MLTQHLLEPPSLFVPHAPDPTSYTIGALQLGMILVFPCAATDLQRPLLSLDLQPVLRGLGDELAPPARSNQLIDLRHQIRGQHDVSSSPCCRAHLNLNLQSHLLVTRRC